MTRSGRTIRLLVAIVALGCGGATAPPPARPPTPRGRIVREHADAPADILDDCDTGFCVGVRGRGADPSFDFGWLSPEVHALGITEDEPGRLCHGYSSALWCDSWDAASTATGIVARTLAEHDSSALVAVCVRVPSRPL